MSIHKTSTHSIRWINVEKQIYDEVSTKYIEVRFVGIKIWCLLHEVSTDHKIMKGNQTIGFEYNNGDKN